MSFRSFARRDFLKGGAAVSVRLAWGGQAMADLLPSVGAGAQLKEHAFDQASLLPGPTKMRLKLATEREFALNLRTAWAGPATRVLVNGKATGEVKPGAFYAVKRGLRDRDVVEMEFGMPVRLETLRMTLNQPSATEPGKMLASRNTAEFAALMSGPMVYAAAGPCPIEMTATSLMEAKAVEGGDACSVATERSPITFRPFMEIDDEMYRTYPPFKEEG